MDKWIIKAKIFTGGIILLCSLDNDWKIYNCNYPDWNGCDLPVVLKDHGWTAELSIEKIL